MAAANKFQNFVEAIGKGYHNLDNGSNLRVLLTNSVPLATNTVRADLIELTTGNGYTQDSHTVASTDYEQVSGTATLTGSNVVFTASGGSIGPFRYVVLYDTSSTTLTDALILWWDYGSAITLLTGETFTVDFSGGILTLA